MVAVRLTQGDSESEQERKNWGKNYDPVTLTISKKWKKIGEKKRVWES